MLNIHKSHVCKTMLDVEPTNGTNINATTTKVLYMYLLRLLNQGAHKGSLLIGEEV